MCLRDTKTQQAHTVRPVNGASYVIVHARRVDRPTILERKLSPSNPDPIVSLVGTRWVDCYTSASVQVRNPDMSATAMMPYWV